MASPWVTPEQLRLHLGLASIDAARAAAVIADAEAIIRADLGQTIDAVAGDTAHLVGNGGDVLILPERPVTAVSSVTVDGTALTEGTDYRWTRHGVLTRLGGACWPLDAAVLAVDDHGWEPVPAVFARVCKQLAGRAWTNPTGALAAESLGDRSVTYARGAGGRLVTGDALTEYEQTLLEPYARGPRSR